MKFVRIRNGIRVFVSGGKNSLKVAELTSILKGNWHDGLLDYARSI